MAEFKFNCPSCSQRIQATDAWVGHTIQCPACHQNIQVPPPAEPSAAAAPESKSGLKIGLATHQKSAPAPVETFSHGANPTRHFSTAQAASGKAEKIKRIGMIAACVLLVPPAGYFGFTAVRDYQTKMNIKRQQEAANSDGGSVGHIASLYDALDKTDPARYSKFGTSTDDKKGKGRATATTGTNAASAAAEEPPVPPTYTLDMERAKLQRGKVNGNLGGTNFVAGGVFVDVAGNVNVLSIRESTNFFSDRELMVYLKLKPGETLAGQSWTIGPDTRTNVPNVVKKWRPNPKFAPQQKSFANGYAMKLEIVNQSQDLVQGRIYLALPDPEQSVVAGQFTATVRQAKPIAAAAPVAPRPQQQQMQQQRPPPQRRY